MQTQVLTILSLAPGSSGTFYPPFVRHTCRYPFSFTYSGYSLEFHSLSLSLSLNRMFVSQRGRSRPVESWWSDSLTVECLASPMMWQINWDLGLLFGFPTKPTHWKRQQKTGGRATDSVCWEWGTPLPVWYFTLLLSLTCHTQAGSHSV